MSTIFLVIVMVVLANTILNTTPWLQKQHLRIRHCAWVVSLIVGGGSVALYWLGTDTINGVALDGGLVSAFLLTLYSFALLYMLGAVLAASWRVLLRWPFVWVAGLRDSRQENRKQKKQARFDREREEAEEKERESQQAQRAVERKRHTSDQKRREDARLECELFYEQHSVALQDRFPKERLEQYMDRYMSDEHSPKTVKERAKKLLGTLWECVENTEKNQHSFSSIAELTDHFRTKRAEVEQADLDDETRESILASIKMNEAIALEKLAQS